MASKQRSVEEIIGKLREAEVALAQGETVAHGMQGYRTIRFTDGASSMGAEDRPGEAVAGDGEAENGRLRRAVADLTLDNQILKEAARGNF